MNIPKHVAIIMDGNGRWARAKGRPRLFGHNAGMQALKEIVKHSDQIGIKYLTVYAFSTENWKRSSEEVSGIFKLLVAYVNQEIDELCGNNVRVNILGDYSKLPKDAYSSVIYALDRTKLNTGLNFNIALNYGGRADIVKSVQELAKMVEKGDLKSSDITEDMISDHLYTSGMPDPDLIIRTSGEFRLSNFLAWQSAYSEIVVTPVLWPDFTPAELDKAIEEFNGRDRRFGAVK